MANYCMYLAGDIEGRHVVLPNLVDMTWVYGPCVGGGWTISKNVQMDVGLLGQAMGMPPT